MNAAFAQLTGYTQDELKRVDWASDLTPPEWREFEQKKLEEQQRTGRPIRYEKEYIRKDGRRIPIELLVHLVPPARIVWWRAAVEVRVSKKLSTHRSEAHFGRHTDARQKRGEPPMAAISLRLLHQGLAGDIRRFVRVAEEVNALDEKIGCEEQIVGAAARTVDGAIVANAGDERRRRRDRDESAQTFGEGALVPQAEV